MMKLTVAFRNFANAPKVVLHVFILGLKTFDALFSDYVVWKVWNWLKIWNVSKANQNVLALGLC